MITGAHERKGRSETIPTFAALLPLLLPLSSVGWGYRQRDGNDSRTQTSNVHYDGTPHSLQAQFILKE
jgi:hypothetical protein